MKKVKTLVCASLLFTVSSTALAGFLIPHCDTLLVRVVNSASSVANLVETKMSPGDVSTPGFDILPVNQTTDWLVSRPEAGLTTLFSPQGIDGVVVYE